MDRFGYAKTIDVSIYERNKETADSENRYVFVCKNTDKICIFTNTGQLHLVKVLDLPAGRLKDKGTPIDNVSNYNSAEEQIIYMCDENQMRIGKFLFTTKQGMVKIVDGSEFLVAKRTIAATKLGDGDELLSVQVINAKQSVVLQTESGYFLRFHSSDISEMKKTAVGVRGIKLQKNDVLEHAYLFEEGKETKVLYKEKEISLNRLKAASRGGSGNKQRV
jgi:DNA gyrase subunit A